MKILIIEIRYPTIFIDDQIEYRQFAVAEPVKEKKKR